MSSAHAGLNHFQVGNNELVIDGQPISRIAARLAPGPFYAYSRELISARVNTLRNQLPSSVEIHYAMKANPMPAVVHHFASLVDGIDVASIAEAQVALHTGLAAQHISFAGPGKQAADIQRAVAAGIILNCESVREVKLALAASQTLGIQAKLALRINPDFELKGSGMKMGGGAKQFGMDVAFVPEAIAAIKAGQAHFVGFHCYAGSQNLKAEALIDAQTKSVALALRLALEADTAPDLFNIGGGFGIPYFPGETALDLAPVCAALRREAEALAKQLPHTRIALELGRYLVGEAGVYCCRVVERKVSQGQVFLITDGGLHHHLAASGNFGQVLRKNYPVCVANRVTADLLEKVHVVGPLCTPLDLLGNAVSLPHADEGDLIAIFQSGAYGYSSSPHQFLSHPMPQEVLL